jgi:hypothetical protein
VPGNRTGVVPVRGLSEKASSAYTEQVPTDPICGGDEAAVPSDRIVPVLFQCEELVMKYNELCSDDL